MISTNEENQPLGKIIHIGSFFSKGHWTYLFLRKEENGTFCWYEELAQQREMKTQIFGHTIEEAMRLAPKTWKHQSFRTLQCGFRYTLPERDEHGINALFHQMVASYATGNGVYYDEELGNNCFIQNASDEALKLWQRLKVQNRVKTSL